MDTVQRSHSATRILRGESGGSEGLDKVLRLRKSCFFPLLTGTQATSTAAASSKATCHGGDLPDSHVTKPDPPPTSPALIGPTVRPTKKQIVLQEQKVNLAAKLRRPPSPQLSVTANGLRGISTAGVLTEVCVCACMHAG